MRDSGNQITKKQFWKRKSWVIAHEIHKGLLDPKDAEEVSMESTKESFPRTSYYKDSNTGVVRLGLSFKGIRKLVKRYPLITTDQVKALFNVS